MRDKLETKRQNCELVGASSHCLCTAVRIEPTKLFLLYNSVGIKSVLAALDSFALLSFVESGCRMANMAIKGGKLRNFE
jgi:hypothetical protein